MSKEIITAIELYYTKEELEQAIRNYIETVGNEEGTDFIDHMKDDKHKEIIQQISDTKEPTDEYVSDLEKHINLFHKLKVGNVIYEPSDGDTAEILEITDTSFRVYIHSSDLWPDDAGTERVWSKSYIKGTYECIFYEDYKSLKELT